MRSLRASCRWIALALAVTPVVASAEENGIRVGDGRLHPYIEVESRQDTLVGYVGEKNAAGGETLNPYGDLGMHVRPGFNLAVPSKTVALDLSAEIDLVQYLGLDNEGTTKQSRVGALAQAAAAFNPEGNVYFKIEDTFRRSDQTTMLVMNVGTITDYNQARFRLGFQPGAKALLVEPGYSLSFEHFEQTEVALAATCTDNDPACDGDSVNAFDYLTHTAHLDASWKFLPKTALVLQSSLASRSYIGEIKATDGSGTTRPLEKFGSDNLRVMAGLSGLITSKIALVALAGWGDQLKADGFGSVIGQAEGVYLFSERTQLKAGYLRTFESNPVEKALYYSDDRIYGNLKIGFGEKASVTGEASYDSIGFGEDRTDGLVRLAIAPSYQVTNWLDATVGFAHTARDTSVTDNDLIAYNRQEFFARLRASY